MTTFQDQKVVDVKIRMFTIVILVGPSQSGKTYMTNNRLIPQIKEQLIQNGIKPIVTYISSDDIRRELLGDISLHKYDPSMLQVSEKAFKLLHAKIDLAAEWPRNSHVIIVDSTGLSEDFRSKIIEQAHATQYNVSAIVFDFKDRDEYTKHVPVDQIDHKILNKHLNRLRTDVWRTMRRDVYDSITTLRNKDFENIRVKVVDAPDYAKTLLDPNLQWDIVGDVHGSLPELKSLLTNAGYQFNDDGAIIPPTGHGLAISGDSIDKGDFSLEVLRLIHKHRQEKWFRIVWGNHENFVSKYLNSELNDVDDKVRLDYFDSTEKFKDNEEFKQMLNDLRAIATNFIVHPNFIVTHAPCHAKYLGKLDSESAKHMRGQYRRPRQENGETLDEFKKKTEEFHKFIKDESIFNAPFHVFGHLSIKSPLRLKNKIGIDTGCVAGGSLTLVKMSNWGPKFLQVKSTRPETEELFDLWVDREQEIDLAALDFHEFKRVQRSAANKVSFISGTMAPAEASEDNLEALGKALQYYVNHGVEEVVLQPKYMGSRCNVYLSKKLEECFATSRNGYVIRRVDLTPVFQSLQQRFEASLSDKKMIVIDGELMPWRALGQGLIDETFKVIEIGLQTEFDILRESGFEQLVLNAKTDIDALKFNDISKEDAIKNLGHAKAGTYRNIIDRPLSSISELQGALDIYKEQVSIFGVDSPLEFKPFGILKIVNEDGTELNCQENGNSNALQFEMVSAVDSRQVVCNLKTKEGWEQARTFFETIIGMKMEGIVVKPLKINSSVAPALKVRGPRYLTLVYGYDYLLPKKYEILIKKKHTRRKVETSIEEFRLGQKMLSIPQKDISEDNKDYARLVAAMIMEEKVEQKLDPRL